MPLHHTIASMFVQTHLSMQTLQNIIMMWRREEENYGEDHIRELQLTYCSTSHVEPHGVGKSPELSMLFMKMPYVSFLDKFLIKWNLLSLGFFFCEPQWWSLEMVIENEVCLVQGE